MKKFHKFTHFLLTKLEKNEFDISSILEDIKVQYSVCDPAHTCPAYFLFLLLLLLRNFNYESFSFVSIFLEMFSFLKANFLLILLMTIIKYFVSNLTIKHPIVLIYVRQITALWGICPLISLTSPRQEWPDFSIWKINLYFLPARVRVNSSMHLKKIVLSITPEFYFTNKNFRLQFTFIL